MPKLKDLPVGFFVRENDSDIYYKLPIDTSENAEDMGEYIHVYDFSTHEYANPLNGMLQDTPNCHPIPFSAIQELAEKIVKEANQ